MGIKCPNCGGGMVFDIARQKLTCPYCDNLCTVAEYRVNNAAEYVNDNYTVSSFRCKNCGAELTAPEEQTVAYCSYCGGEAMLQQKQTETIRPKRIIPFRKTKQDAIQAYETAVKKVLYVPKELKDASFLEGFRGVYLPYWGIDVNIPQRELSFKGTRTYTQGKYDYHETYDVTAQVGGQVEGAIYDASAAFDDTLAAQIAPFDQKGSKPFDEAYLAGFYADKVTARPEVYRSLAEEQAADKVFENINKQAGKVTVSVPSSKEKRIETIGAKATGEKVSLFPVWFLTWRRKDRVAYSVMNGQSGKISMDLPVDLKQFFLFSAAAAAVLFVVLNPKRGAAEDPASGTARLRLRERIRGEEGQAQSKGCFLPGFRSPLDIVRPPGGPGLRYNHRQQRHRGLHLPVGADRANRPDREAHPQRGGHTA